MVVVADGRAVVSTGPGDDSVTVSTEPATGQTVIDVNGVKHYQPSGTEVTIRVGEGTDTVAVAGGTPVVIEVVGVAGVIKLDGSALWRERVLGGLSVEGGAPARSGLANVVTIRESGMAEGRIVELYHESGRVYRRE